MNDPARIRRRYRQFADTECRGYSSLYYGLALAVADDDEMVGFIAGMPEIQPNLFLAAVQLLTGPDDMPRTGSELRAFVRRSGREIGDVMRARRTQTNEVGRCAVLLPALPQGPLALLEVGASAGLCLLLDRFHYQYAPSPLTGEGWDGGENNTLDSLGATPTLALPPRGGGKLVGEAASPVHLRCAPAGPVPVPAVVPRVAWRRGLDLHPIDVHDDDAVRWLLACVYADHRERRRRLEAAIGLARLEPAVVSAGDLVDDLPAVLDEAPPDARLVVFHSAVLTYVKADRREAFAEVLAGASRKRDIVWLSNEAPGVVPGVTAREMPHGELRYVLTRTLFTNGERRDEVLAHAQVHGADVAWF